MKTLGKLAFATRQTLPHEVVQGYELDSHAGHSTRVRRRLGW